MSSCSFRLNPLVSRQVSELHGSTTFTFHPETFILVLVISALDRHIGINIANACLALSICAWMTSLLTYSDLQGREFVYHLDVNGFHSVLSFNEHTIAAFGIDTHHLCLWGIDLQVYLCTLLLKACALSLMLCTLCDSRAGSRSSKDVVKDRWIPCLLAKVSRSPYQGQPGTAREIAGSLG